MSKRDGWPGSSSHCAWTTRVAMSACSSVSARTASEVFVADCGDHSRHALGDRNVGLDEAGTERWRPDDPGFDHAGYLDVLRVPGAAGDAVDGVDAKLRPAHDGEVFGRRKGSIVGDVAGQLLTGEEVAVGDATAGVAAGRKRPRRQRGRSRAGRGGRRRSRAGPRGRLRRLGAAAGRRARSTGRRRRPCPRARGRCRTSTTSTALSGRRNSSATSIASPVRMPWPYSTLPAYKVTLESGVT